MTRTTRSRTVLTVALSVLALVVVTVAGWTGYRRARADAVASADATVRIDGVPHDCGPHRGVYVEISGPVGARYVVDGVEVPAQQLTVDGPAPAGSSALLPDPRSAVDCAGAVVHRYEVLTPTPGGCSWSVDSQQTQEEGRGHQYALQASGHECTLTLG